MTGRNVVASTRIPSISLPLYANIEGLEILVGQITLAKISMVIDSDAVQLLVDIAKMRRKQEKG